MMRYGEYGYGTMGYGWGLIMMIGVLVIVVLVIFALSRYLQNSGSTSQNNSSSKAIEILDERYARGEITDEEYKKKKAEMKA